VQAACAFVHPLQSHLSGVFAEDSGLVHVALNQANAMAIFEVNRGDEQHKFE
jgi:hypothetical protein